ncbi:MAG: radical SAM protein [Candidatus Aminicenantales bacterium]
MKFEPKWIAWEATPRCNLRCIHCRSAANPENKEVFSTEDAFNLIDNIASFCSPVFVLSGGEPLLRKDVFEIASYGTEKGFRVCLATNGTLINDERCRRIKDSGICLVSLSLDGSSREIHDNFRNQKGAFDRILLGIEKLKKHNIEFIINSSFTNRNKHDIPATFHLAKKLGAKAWYMFMIVPTGRGKGIFQELVSKEDYETILNWHYELERSEGEILLRPTCAPHYYRIFAQRSKAENLPLERRNLSFSTGGGKGCVAAQTISFIDYRGEVMPCSYFPKSAGNLREKSFREIWNSPLFQELRDFTAYKGKCGGCEYLHVCGGCRARAYAVSGDYLDEEPFCDYQPPISSVIPK